MKCGLENTQQWKTKKVILNLSADLLLKDSQAFKIVHLMMAEHSSELTVDLNFWEKAI